MKGECPDEPEKGWAIALTRTVATRQSPSPYGPIIAAALTDVQGLFWTAFGFVLVILAYGELSS